MNIKYCITCSNAAKKFTSTYLPYIFFAYFSPRRTSCASTKNTCAILPTSHFGVNKMLIKINIFICFVEGMLENVNDNVHLRKIGFIDKIWPYTSSKRVVCMRNRISTTGVNFSYLNLVHARI